MSVALGIDLGTTNSVAAIATPTGVEFILGPRGERVHPSVVAFPSSGGVVVGADAKRYRLTEPHHVIHSAKRFIGQNIRAPLVQLAMTGVRYRVEEGPNQQPIVVVRDRRMTMPEISSNVLLHLKRCAERQLGTPIKDAVVTVPANFTDGQRQATKEAGRLAGLDVMRLINEPTAAALAYGFGRDRQQVICVFDFGGGTFDVSILRLNGEVFEVLASEGDFFLGGDDLDRALGEVLAAECNRILRVDPRPHAALMMKLMMGAEAIKMHLSENDAAEGEIDGLDLPGAAGSRLPFQITRKQFEDLIAGYVNRTCEVTKQVLLTAGIDARSVSEILCVGGSTRIPLVRQRLAEVFRKEPNTSINPDEVVSQGAAIQAGSLVGNLSSGTGMGARDAVATTAHSRLGGGGNVVLPEQQAKRPILMDVNPATLAIQTAGGFTERLLDKNSPIPIERTRVFTTSRDNQTRVEIDCCRGEARRYTENEPLGTLVLEGLPAKPRGDLKIEVSFRVDADGILHVRAADQTTGVRQEAHLQVLGAPSAMDIPRVSTRTDVLLWAQRILAMTAAPAHQLLEIKADASIEAAQDAFHKIARSSHPDIHRSGLTPEELEDVTLAYARCAGAYQDFRSQRMQTNRMRPIKDVPATPIPGVTMPPATKPAPAGAKPGSAPSAAQVTGGAGGSGQMNSKALIYYRKAELALKRGDLKGALLQVKMAIAGDPQSAFLRSALVEIEAELAKQV